MVSLRNSCTFVTPYKSYYMMEDASAEIIQLANKKEIE